jgi:fucose permease
MTHFGSLLTSYYQWIGNFQDANECLGFLHGAYGLGATLSPLIATSMVTKGHLQWYAFYYVMVRYQMFLSSVPLVPTSH